MRFYRSKSSIPPQGAVIFLVGVVDYLAEELITHPDVPHMTETTERRDGASPIGGGAGCRVLWSTALISTRWRWNWRKLSLWLHTVAKGQPLSFLDHHIRYGNSLIGAKIENLPNLPELRRNRRSSRRNPNGDFRWSFLSLTG